MKKTLPKVRNEIDKELRRYGRPFTESQKNEVVENVAKRAGFLDVDDFITISATEECPFPSFPPNLKTNLTE